MHKYDIVETGSRPEEASNALILLHGRGGTAENILPLANYFTDGSWYVAAPQATNSQWYPYSFMAPAVRNEPWLSSAIDLVNRLIREITEIVPMENVYLMGFSQGACLSSEVAARSAGRYGGIVAFTGGLIGEEPDIEKYSGNFEGTRIYLTNGDNDPHIPQERSRETKRQFLKMGAEVRLDIIPDRDHTITPEEIENAMDFIIKKN
jgi:phospholipase/carboxylesterase